MYKYTSVYKYTSLRNDPNSSKVAATSPIFGNSKSLYYSADNMIHEYDLESQKPNLNTNIRLPDSPKSFIIVPVGKFNFISE